MRTVLETTATYLISSGCSIYHLPRRIIGTCPAWKVNVPRNWLSSVCVFYPGILINSGASPGRFLQRLTCATVKFTRAIVNVRPKRIRDEQTREARKKVRGEPQMPQASSRLNLFIMSALFISAFYATYYVMRKCR